MRCSSLVAVLLFFDCCVKPGTEALCTMTSSVPRACISPTIHGRGSRICAEARDPNLHEIITHREDRERVSSVPCSPEPSTLTLRDKLPIQVDRTVERAANDVMGVQHHVYVHEGMANRRKNLSPSSRPADWNGSISRLGRACLNRERLLVHAPSMSGRKVERRTKRTMGCRKGHTRWICVCLCLNMLVLAVWSLFTIPGM
jgi:hypothetical protein